MGNLSNCKLGFTLAEVLVTLGIIGIVSAMTMPTLIQNHQRKVYVTELHKVYSEFQQATLAQINSRNAIDLLEAGVRNDNAFNSLITNQFKIVKNCTGNPSNCFADSYRNLSGGTATTYSDTSAPCYALASGAVICAKYERGSSTSNGLNLVGQSYDLVGSLIVDVNGKARPNIIGRDLFIMGIAKDGTLTKASKMSTSLGQATTTPHFSLTESTLQKCQKATSVAPNSKAAYCFDLILSDNWEMTY